MNKNFSEHVVIRNSKVLKSLEDYKDAVISVEDKLQTKLRYKNGIHNPGPCGINYLYKIMTDKRNLERYMGPQDFSLTDLIRHAGDGTSQVDEARKKILAELPFIDRLVVEVFYKPGDFIGWHHNGDDHGYFFLVNWSETGDGYFKLWDHQSMSEKKQNDIQGWTTKAGHFVDCYKQEEDLTKLSWHCAETKSRRLCLGFKARDKQHWEEVKGILENET